jgi:hypothetical protein
VTFQPAREGIERSETDRNLGFGPSNRFIAEVAGKPTVTRRSTDRNRPMRGQTRDQTAADRSAGAE